MQQFGKPAIFIPLPNVSDNHQEYNAKVLESKQAAKIINNSELNGEKLNKEIQSLLKEKDELKTMGENSKKIHIENVEDKIYKQIQKIYKK